MKVLHNSASLLSITGILVIAIFNVKHEVLRYSTLNLGPYCQVMSADGSPDYPVGQFIMMIGRSIHWIFMERTSVAKCCKQLRLILINYYNTIS